ncbi:MAG: hypothetical protein DKT66_04705 [Candidatus Melainabacteria bacterium]|nr:MAG: hypothetical protein DKT66_04705 [Candidatus Melainabacteria bacterium]
MKERKVDPRDSPKSNEIKKFKQDQTGLNLIKQDRKADQNVIKKQDPRQDPKRDSNLDQVRSKER